MFRLKYPVIVGVMAVNKSRGRICQRLQGSGALGRRAMLSIFPKRSGTWMLPPLDPPLSLPRSSRPPSEGWGDCWEHGSEDHALFARRGSPAHPWQTGGVFYGSGRDALRALMTDGRDHRGWRRMWIPSFFCQEVVGSILRQGLEILPYRAGPEEPRPEWSDLPLRQGDAVLRVNLFGLQTLPSLEGRRQNGVEFIDDHTHDPWSSSAWHSDADWCVASLRKTVPVPDGGVAWSPSGRQLPPCPELTTERRLASVMKLAAMAIKDCYLRGADVEKDLFRSLAVQGEAGIGEGPPSAMAPWSRTIMSTMPLAEWRQTRRDNHRTLATALAGLPGARILSPADETACPFFLVLVFHRPEMRDRVKQGLVAERIYPGSHWPMDPPAIQGIPEDHLDLSRRIMTLHCDLRYRAEDMRRVASAVWKTVEGAKPPSLS